MKHYTNRSSWLRASVLGANDGIISTTSLVIGVAVANVSRESIILVALAGLIAGASSMAAGEYVSVSSQSDIEKADLKREKHQLDTMPDTELEELAGMYEERGLDKELAIQVATQLTQHNALDAHAKEELGINHLTKAKPLEAALASFASFIVGGILPFLVALFAPITGMAFYQYAFAIVFLAVSGALAAKMGGSKITKAVWRICFWGTMAMVFTALVGYIFGVQTT